MAFISGPRQVGKTTLARKLLADFGQGRYFSWDDLTDQRRLAKDPYFYEKLDRDHPRPSVLVFDELHKYRKWKAYLKGAFDRSRGEYSFIVTGSGRLDLYSRGGDSLMGRYLRVPLFPLSVGELTGAPGTWARFTETLSNPPVASPEVTSSYGSLMSLNGFPEPLVRGEAAFLSTWSSERTRLLVREDIRDATALREDLGVAFETVRDWVNVLHQFYYCFPVMPWSRSLARAIRKAVKVYLFDWFEVPGEAPRFENVVALHLQKAVSLWNAYGEAKATLRYVRDREKCEVDFVVADREKPVCLVECKLSDTSPSPHLLRFQQMLRAPVAVQLVATPGTCRKMKTDVGTAWVVSADRWLAGLP